MTPIDWALAGTLLISALIGLLRGFVREAMSLAVWVLALWAAWRYGDPFSDQFVGTIDDVLLRLWAARLGIIVAIVFTGSLAGWLIAYLIDRTGLTGTDRVVGMVFGFGRGALLVALLVFVLRFVGFERHPWWQESTLVPYAGPFADRLQGMARRELLAISSNGDDDSGQ